MSKFTPGPWKNYGGSIFAAVTDVDGKVGTQFVCECKAIEGADNIANARLIAAAPDMYEALNNLVTGLEAGAPHSQIQDMLHTASNIIKTGIAGGESALREIMNSSDELSIMDRGMLAMHLGE